MMFRGVLVFILLLALSRLATAEDGFWTTEQEASGACELLGSADPLHVEVAEDGGATKLPGSFGTGRLVAYNLTDHDPLADIMPSGESVKTDARALFRLGFQNVTTYGSSPALSRICRRFKRAGFERVLVGVWDPADEAEVRAAINQRRCADGYVVGSEGITFGRYTREELEGAIDRVRAATAKPVTTREALGAYAAGKGLLTVGDWVYPLGDLPGQRHTEGLGDLAGAARNHDPEGSEREELGGPAQRAHMRARPRT